MAASAVFLPESSPWKGLSTFLQKRGHTLLIKGLPGTGKTTLALELMRAHGEKGKGVYLSTRVSPGKLYSQFPWLEEIIKPEHIVPTVSELEATRFEDLRLADAQHLIGEIFWFKDELVNPFVVLDTWDSIAKEMTRMDRLRAEKAIMAMVENSDMRVIFVSEEPSQTTVDYLVDGILKLRTRMVEGRRLRELEVEKLRGVRVERPQLVFTLEGGQFGHLRPFKPTEPEEPRKFEPITHGDGYFSTGIADLDMVLGGGLNRGSYNLLEVGESVPVSSFAWLLSVILCNFAAQGNAAIVMPAMGMDPGPVKKIMEMYIDRQVFLDYVRIGSFRAQGVVTEPYIVRLRGKSLEEDSRRITTLTADFKEKRGQPVFTSMGYDTIEYIYGWEQATRIIGQFAATVRREGDASLDITRPGLRITPEMKNFSDVYLKMVEMYGSLLLYGLKPRTALYHVEPDVSQGFPQIRLVPMV